MQNWYKLLGPDGIMIVFVPAFMSLWSPHDEVNHHFRRYAHRELTDKISKASFSVLRHGYWNATLLIPIMLYRFLRNTLEKAGLKEQKPSADLGTVPAPVNALLKGLLSIENSMMELIRFPFGVSTFCVARKNKCSPLVLNPCQSPHTPLPLPVARPSLPTESRPRIRHLRRRGTARPRPGAGA